MQITFIQIPQYSFTTHQGNFNPGRGGVAVDTFVYHWIDGTQAVADLVFKNPAKVRSAHFSIEDDNVHQYVRLQDTAFHTGIYAANQRSIGIEHSAEPGRDATDATYESSAQIVFQTAHALGKRVGDFAHLPHSHYKNTACPGTLDIGRIVNRALQLEALSENPPVSSPVLQTIEVAFHPVIQRAFDPFETNLQPYGSTAPASPDPEVKRMQAFLTAKINPDTHESFFKDAGAQDGWYGPKTQRAVHDFQIANGITGASQYGWWWTKTRDAANHQLVISETSNV